MAYKCRICGTNDVEHQGDVCELCAIGQDPYVTAMQSSSSGFSGNNFNDFQAVSQPVQDTYKHGKKKSRKVLIGGAASIANTDPYGNTMTVQSNDSDFVQIYQAGQVPTSVKGTQDVVVNSNISSINQSIANTNIPLTTGITKNITVDIQKKSALRKLLRTLFKGIPYTFDNDITIFQVFPDYTGTSLNAMGNACDQVIVYGKLNAGAIAENNTVEVYGHRDSDNNIVAKKIVNKASGTTVTPDRVIPVAAIWTITMIVFSLLAIFIGMCGVEGIVWAVILVLCFTNLPLIFKIFATIIGFMFSIIRKM